MIDFQVESEGKYQYYENKCTKVNCRFCTKCDCRLHATQCAASASKKRRKGE